MNVLKGGAPDLAAAIKFRLIRNRASLAVWADEFGDVVMDRAHDPRRKTELPGEFLIGVYTVGVQVDDIAGDIAARRAEIEQVGPPGDRMTCTRCKNELALDQFMPRSDRPGRRYRQCTPCRRKVRKG